MAAASRRAWGWHGLADPWAARIVRAAGVRPGELVVDLGAGYGALTAQLVAAGARVIAVELHPGRASMLRQRFPPGSADVSVVERDALSFVVPRRPFRVVANPPYAIASPLLRRLLSRGSGLVAADLVLQRALVRRTVARPSGRYAFAAGMPLPRSAFRPPPSVDSMVLQIRRG